MDNDCGGHSEGEVVCGLNRVTGCIRLARLGVNSPSSTLVLLGTGIAITVVCVTLNWVSSVDGPSGTCLGEVCGDNNSLSDDCG